MAIKKNTISKVKGKISRGAIGAPTGDSPSTPDLPGDGGELPSLPSTPLPPGGETRGNRTYYAPKSSGQPFEPVGVPNDNEWHHDDQHVVSEHLLNYGKNPLDVARFWFANDGEHLKNAQPYDPQHGDYSGFDFNAPDWTTTNKDYQNAIKHPGYEGDVGQPAPVTKKPKPSGDQHASYSPGAASVETIRNVPGSYATGVVNGMTNRDKYVNY